MKLLKTALATLCVIGFTTGCASYKSCPAYAQQSQEEIYSPDYQSQAVQKRRNLQS